MSSNTKGNFENLAFDHGFSINISYNNCPSSFPVHWHNYAEMVFLNGKEITYTVNGKEHQLHQGDFLFIWPGELHAVLPNQQPDILICQFNSLLLDTIKMLLKSNYMLLRNLRLISHLECPKICETMASHLYIIKKICRKKGKHNSLSDMHMCIELFKLFTTLCSFLIEESDKKVFNGSVQANEATQKIIAACNYISNNCSRDISLEDAASYVGFSKYYFSRLFREYTGVSFVDYVAEQRLHYAEVLLGNPQLNITDAAMQAGFGSISTFNRIFKQKKGCTPSEFRALFQGK